VAKTQVIALEGGILTNIEVEAIRWVGDKAKQREVR